MTISDALPGPLFVDRTPSLSIDLTPGVVDFKCKVYVMHTIPINICIEWHKHS